MAKSPSTTVVNGIDFITESNIKKIKSYLEGFHKRLEANPYEKIMDYDKYPIFAAVCKQVAIANKIPTNKAGYQRINDAVCPREEDDDLS